MIIFGKCKKGQIEVLKVREILGGRLEVRKAQKEKPKVARKSGQMQIAYSGNENAIQNTLARMANVLSGKAKLGKSRRIKSGA